MAGENVHQLRQLVKRRTAEDGAEFGHPWIVWNLDQRLAVATVNRQQTIELHVRPVHHRAELPDAEVPTLSPDALLGEYGRTRGRSHDCQCDGGQEGEQDHDQDGGGNSVDDILQEKLATGDPSAHLSVSVLSGVVGLSCHVLEDRTLDHEGRHVTADLTSPETE